jgi:hypothetical protein
MKYAFNEGMEGNRNYKAVFQAIALSIVLWVILNLYFPELIY